MHPSPRSASPREVRVPLGRLVATTKALELLKATGTNPAALLSRHHTGDWGDIDPEDQATNDASLRHGHRVISRYRLNPHDTLWIITEADRSVTTLLLPDEY